MKAVERWIVSRLVARDLARRHQRIRSRQPDLSECSPHCATLSVVDGEVTGRTRDKVLILGGGPSRFCAPLDDPSYEVWCCNDLAAICCDSEGRFRADRWFEVHPRDPVVQWRRRTDFWEWLGTLPIPVYQFGRTDNPQSVEFPLRDVIDLGRDYFGCTFAYQIGLALREGFSHIALYGVDLLTAREATVERATVEWWAGFAEGRGVTVEWSPVGPEIRAGVHPARYGYVSPWADYPNTDCERERGAVYNWIRDHYAPTIPGFLIGNRPPWTLAEWWRWRRA